MSVAGRVTENVVNDAIQSSLAEDLDLGDCYVTNWVAVVEVIGDDGRRWLVRLNSGTESEPLPEWVEHGLLFSALHHPEYFDSEEAE